MIGWFTHNLGWKLLSFLIAFGLWAIVVREPELVTSHSAPVFFKDLPKDLEIGSDVIDRVHLEIRGPEGKLTPNSLADTALVLDLSSVRNPGERTFTVSEPSLNLPRGVTFLRAIPSQLRLRFERVLTKEVPVQVHIATPQPAGYTMIDQVIKPDKLKITGPENRVARITAAQTDPIDLSGVVSNAEFHVHAYVDDSQVRFEGNSMVSLRVYVEKIHSGK
jgi:YbbR domain-containing protein